jgi:branched-chain amino acid transport system permease protein
MRCVSEDNVISQSLGIRVKRIYTIAWIIGCLSAMIGGILLSSVIGSVYASRGGMDGLAIMMALPIVILGGLESIAGAYLAALLVGLLKSLGGFYIDPYIRGFSDVLPWVLLVLVMLVRPQGLFGLKGIKRI